MTNILGQPYNEVKTGNLAVQEKPVGLKTRRTDLKNRLNSWFRALFLAANRESSTWLALSAEYGPNEPITQAFNSDFRLVQMGNYGDRY
jgi:hypothetical protein